MSVTQDDLRETVIAGIDEFFDGVFAPLETWRPRLQHQLAEYLPQRSLTGAQLSALIEDDANAMLESTDRPIYGAGFCATDSVVNEGNPLAWWQGPDRALLAASTFAPGQESIDLHRKVEWFRVPAETRAPHIAGPFVDYLCSNEITLTSAIPVDLDDEFVGVLCADVLVASLEDLLLPLISGLDGAAIVNASGRVVVSANEAFETGDRFLSSAEHTKSTRYPFSLALPSRVAV